MQRNKTKITITDFGAGSRVNNNNQKKIKTIAKSSVSSSIQGQFLFRLIHHYKPKTILEIGTSLGITTLYHALPNPDSQVITLEGCPEISKVARQNFKTLKAKNIKLITGQFEKTLIPSIAQLQPLDYVFFDGNHRKAPTLAYFEMCLPFAHNDTIFVFDDIYWSPEMTAAWRTIQQHKSVSYTIDLFHFGLVFFKKGNDQKTTFYFSG